jgi:N6-L-threonylcarbamoyladenine synthase
MKILGIETSCDETSASIVENGNIILSNAVASSSDIHKKTGGIIPENAAREQVKSIIPIINEALNSAFNNNSGFNNLEKIDKIAVTAGPGLIGSLLVGVETAKTLSFLNKIHISPINHLKAHPYANWLEKDDPPLFPALSLVISGGHTDLVLMTSHTDILWLGGTRDDAAGEAFDKTARILGLPYPGGPEISKRAENYLSVNSNDKLDLFPRPMIEKENFEWSFSGLKTAVINEVRDKKDIDVDMYCAQIQEAIVDVLVFKSMKAVKKYKPKSFLVSGGVAANQRLTMKLKSKFNKIKTTLYIPNPKFCTDNATFISSRAFFTQKAVSWKRVVADPELSLRN